MFASKVGCVNACPAHKHLTSPHKVGKEKRSYIFFCYISDKEKGLKILTVGKKIILFSLSLVLSRKKARVFVKINFLSVVQCQRIRWVV